METSKHLRSVFEEWARLRAVIEDLHKRSPKLGASVNEVLKGTAFPRHALVATTLLRAMLGEPANIVEVVANALAEVGPVELVGEDLGLALESLENKNVIIVRAALALLSESHLEQTPWAAKSLEKLMKHHDANVRHGAVKAIRQLGTDLASGLLPSLMQAIDEENCEARTEVISVLAWLGSEAVSAIDAIVDTMLYDPKNVVQIAAISALMKIDPSGERVKPYLVFLPDEERRGQVLELLRCQGMEARPLRRLLEMEWNPPTHVNGPESPDKFWYEGVPHIIEHQTYLILSCVWGREQIPLAEVVKIVWKDEEPSSSAIKSAVYKTNEVLRNAGAGWICGQKNGFITKKIQ